MKNENEQTYSNGIIEQIINYRFIVLGLSGIFFVGLLIRLYNIPFGIPLELDATTYFVYAYKLSETFQFPYWSHFPNNGWPTFLSVFFMFFESNNFMDYILIQRIVGVILSTSTSIVVYFLCRRFFSKNVSLIGAAIFCFEPRVIFNSVLGITEPLYILLISLSILFTIAKNSRYVYFAFLVAGFATLVRYEGLLIIIPISIVYFLHNKRGKRAITKYLILISIFILVISPMMIIRNDTMGQDGIFSHYIGGSTFLSNRILQGMPDDDGLYQGDPGINNPTYFLNLALTNFVKFLGWTMIPIFILFIPISLMLLFKNKSWKNIDSKTLLIILSLIVLALPTLYGYGRGIMETRYLYVLFPLFCIISIYMVNEVFMRISRKKILVCLTIAGLITISTIFIDIEKENYEHAKETFEISKIIVEKTEIINANPIDKSFLTVSGLMKIWPETPNIDDTGGLTTSITKKSLSDFETIEDTIEANILTHIVLDDKNPKKFLNDIFHNEKKYEYLEKVYDSKLEGYNYHVKIFQIDYNKYYEIKEILNN